MGRDNGHAIPQALEQLEVTPDDQPPMVHVLPATVIGRQQIELAGRDEQIRLLLIERAQLRSRIRELEADQATRHG